MHNKLSQKNKNLSVILSGIALFLFQLWAPNAAKATTKISEEIEKNIRMHDSEQTYPQLWSKKLFENVQDQGDTIMVHNEIAVLPKSWWDIEFDQGNEILRCEKWNIILEYNISRKWKVKLLQGYTLFDGEKFFLEMSVYPFDLLINVETK